MIIIQLIKKFPVVMESMGLLLCSLKPVLGPYSEPVYSPTHLCIIHCNIIVSSVIVYLNAKLGHPQLEGIYLTLG